MAIPLILDNAVNRASGAVDRFGASTLIWSDEFGGSEIKADRWMQPTLSKDRNGNDFQRRLWQVNVTGHDNDGNVFVNPDGSPQYRYAPEGKRHAIWYDGPKDANGNIDRSRVQYVQNGQLVLGGATSNERDPTIDTTTINPETGEPYHPYFDGRGPDAGVADLRNKIFGAWLQGCDAIEDVENFNEKIVDPQSPRQIFRYGFYQFRIDFSQMQRGDAYRVSAWLMPQCHPTAPDLYLNGVTYDRDPKTGLEIDIFEHENAHGGRNSDLLLMKSIDGADKNYWERTYGSLDTFAPGTEATVATEVGPGFNLRAGTHVIGLWWAPTGMRYYLNGYEANVDLTRIPKVGQAFYWTREGNTCLNYSSGPTPYPPQRQKENGYLFGDNIGKNPGLIDDDKVYVDYLRIWQDPSLDGPPEDENTNWRSAQTYGKIDPTTPGGTESDGGTAPTIGTGGGTSGGGAPSGGDGAAVAVDRELDYTVHYDPITAPGVPASISVRVKSVPLNARVGVAWTHDAGAEAVIDDPSALSTAITVTGAASRLIDVQPNVTLISTLPNVPPVARAGDDVSAEVGEQVTLPRGGSQSTDPDGSSLTYAWTSASGTVLGTNATLTTSLPSAGTAEITLTVTDSEGATSSDTMRLTAFAAIVAPDVPEISSLTAVSATRLRLEHTYSAGATGHSSQISSDGATWVDLGYHLESGRFIDNARAGATNHVRIRAENRDPEPEQVSAWSAPTSVATPSQSVAAATFTYPTEGETLDTSTVDFKWDGPSAPYHTWLTVRGNLSRTGSSIYSSGWIEDGRTNQIVYGMPSDGREFEAELATMAVDGNGDRFGEVLRRYVKMKARTASVSGGGSSGDGGTSTGGRVIQLSSLEQLGKKSYVTNNGGNLTLEDKDFSHVPARGVYESTVFIRGYDTVTIRRCRFTNARFGDASWPYVSDQSHSQCALKIERCKRVILEEVETRGGFRGLSLERCDSHLIRFSRFWGAYKICLMRFRCEQDNGYPQSIAEFIHAAGDTRRGSTSSTRSLALDVINVYDCLGTSSKPILTRKFVSEDGYGPFGGGLVLGDGGDLGTGNTGRVAGWQVAEDGVILNYDNKAWGITGGANNTVRRLMYRQDQSDARFGKGDGDVGGYVGDSRYGSDNPKDTGFGGHRVENCTGHHVKKNGSLNAFSDYSGESFGGVFDRQSTRATVVGNDFDNNRPSRNDLNAKKAEYLAQVVEFV